MLIDWFTVGAQALNFLILVWLMKRFLFKPIRDAIDAREKLIAAALSDAEASKADAKKEREDYRQKNDAFDQERTALVAQASTEADAERKRLLDAAHMAADALSAKRAETARSDAHNLNQAITRQARTEVFAIARKALADLADTGLEERIGAVFTRRLREMDGETKATLANALRTASAPSVVRTAFDLPHEQHAVIQNALNETFSAEVNVRFVTAPELVSGIELVANGQKLSWSIAGYLTSLETGVSELLEENVVADKKTVAMPDEKPATIP